jgi:RNA polymerase sigma-70 factor (ECF subfamily)
MTMTAEPGTDRTPLVLAAREGDADAFEALVRGEYATLVRAARAILSDVHEAEDAAVETFLAAWRGLAALKDPARFGPWLSRILVRTARRRLGRRAGRPVPADLDRVPAPEREEDPRLDRLLAELARLPDDHREVLSVYYLREHTMKETAEALGLSPKRVKSRLFEARKLLRRRLDDDDE